MLHDVYLDFRDSMGRLATGVTVVTTTLDDRPWGMTVSACCSVSLEPPLLLVSLLTKTASATQISKNQRFGVSVLRSTQEHIARAGAQPGTPKFFDEYARFDSLSGTYKVDGSLAHVHCSLSQTVVAGDHTIFIGAVEHATLGDPGEPLMHFSRQFGSFSSLDPALTR